MITKINAKSADKYTALFEKATAILKEKAADTLRKRIADANASLPAEEQFTWDNFGIGSLNEYFSVLEDLINIKDLTEDEKAFYLRLPLDEDVFAINADTRTITIPNNFARNGVGVQGDESAEVLYFTIDRYFDSMDLADDEIQIRIQWEARDANKNIIRGISKNFGKDIESEAGKGLMIFGWPISSTLTQTNGTIKFAVRFFKKKNDTILSYSFTTLPAEVTINASLDYNMLEKMEHELDDGQDIINRIHSSGIFDTSGPVPTKPIITTNLYVYDPFINDVKIVDLPANDESIKLAVSAKPADIGIIEYNWKKYTYDKATGDYASSPITVTSGIEQVPVQQTTAIAENDIERYYIKTQENGNDKFTKIELEDLESREPDENGKFIYNNMPITLWKLYSVLTIENNSNAAGIYTVDIKARTIVNSATTYMNSADGIEIPGPKQPEFEANETHIIADDGNAVLTVSAHKNLEEKNYENAKVDLTYKWNTKVNETINPIDETYPEPDMTMEVIPGNQLFKYDAERQEKAIHNANSVDLIQKGNNIYIYKKANAELETYVSTNEYQASKYPDGAAWLALIIDTKQAESVNNLYWNHSSMAPDDEAGQAEGVGYTEHHIVYWPVLDENETWPKTITIGPSEDETDEDVELKVYYSEQPLNNITYVLADDNKELSIYGLPTENLDVSYVASVTAERNKISTTANSVNYRITNSPKKPKLYERVYDNGVWTNKLLVEAEERHRRVNNDYVIKFSIDPDIKSDELYYLWMKMNETNDPSDIVDGVVQYRADLDNLIEGFDAEGPADYAIDDTDIETLTQYNIDRFRKVLDKKNLKSLGELVENEENVPTYTIKAGNKGAYYCIVVNKLNEHIAATLTPFYIID